MDIIQILQKEFDAEVATTRNMLERVPNDQWSWKPHAKSMTMEQLTTHLADLPGWVTMALNTSELDFASQPYEPTQVSSRNELLQIFERQVEKGRDSLSQATEEDLSPSWTLRNGEQVYMTMNKYEVIRHALSQMIHHRAQLGVYLRLLNIAIPGSYGPSADEGHL